MIEEILTDLRDLLDMQGELIAKLAETVEKLEQVKIHREKENMNYDPDDYIGREFLTFKEI